MKLFKKALLAAALLAPVGAFAQSVEVDQILTATLSSPTIGYTGHLEFAGDGDAGEGGVGWLNDDNTTYNEMDFRYITSGETFIAIQQQRAMAAASAAHLGGKGAVFHVTTAGFSGQCIEDVTLASTAASSDGNALSGVMGATGVFVAGRAFTNAAITAVSPRTDYTLALCTPVEG